MFLQDNSETNILIFQITKKKDNISARQFRNNTFNLSNNAKKKTTFQQDNSETDILIFQLAQKQNISARQFRNKSFNLSNSAKTKHFSKTIQKQIF